MNYRGSYRKLLAHSKAAMLAAIEVYNKPQMPYRDECVTVLLVNSWELLAKAILSKNKQKVFRKKIRGQPYRTLELQDALGKASKFFPDSIPYQPVRQNILKLVHFRNCTIHFYNEPGLSAVVYGLAQTNIMNYKDLVLAVFRQDITQEITITLLPLAFGSPPDPISFLRDNSVDPPSNKFVGQFVREVVDSTRYFEQMGLDTGRFLTQFDVSLHSVKKISSADIVVGIDGSAEGSDSSKVILRDRDSNKRFPLRRKDVIQKVGTNLNGVSMNAFVLDAIIYAHGCKDNKRHIWKAIGGGSMQYSPEFVKFIKQLTKADVHKAISEYKTYRAQRRRTK